MFVLRQEPRSAAGRIHMITSLVTALVLMLPPIPGALNASVRPWNMAQTVCVPGWSAKHRPSTAYTGPIKDQLLVSRHLPGTVQAYQLDHEISLGLGGAPRSRLNLWMQPLRQARRDDRLEAQWHRWLCDGIIGLRAVQRLELQYKRSRG